MGSKGARVGTVHINDWTALPRAARGRAGGPLQANLCKRSRGAAALMRGSACKKKMADAGPSTPAGTLEAPVDVEIGIHAQTCADAAADGGISAELHALCGFIVAIGRQHREDIEPHRAALLIDRG